ncbi:HAD family hydrolase [Nesterenkonia sp. F]|uniref:HAD family hydrolase n=1 Tax=Nesterenkonia sp. F TaxID=795955 RepID=UPI000255D127|nr:HAD family hydrolase [Nesterenkonia sp. F]
MTIEPLLRNVPEALLLDFGGVIVETRKHPDGRDRLAGLLTERLRRALLPADAREIRRSLDAALTALKHWKHAQSRRPAPQEMSPREVVADFLAADLPTPARTLLTVEADEVLAEVTCTLSAHDLRPGVEELLDLADSRGLPVGVVSNAHSGRSHRMLLDQLGLADRIAVQCYSDEIGLRKPHPGLIELAAEALGTAPERCWYVGDTQDRDVVAGRRAGAGVVVLTRSHHTDHPPFAVADQADAVLETPAELATALRETLDAAPTTAGPPASNSTGGGDGDAVDEVDSAATPSRGALLIDHGGVISTSAPDPEALEQMLGHLTRLLDHRAPEPPLGRAGVLERLTAARAEHKSAKRRDPLQEISPRTFWHAWFGAELSARRRALLAAEATDLMARWGAAKSRRLLRRGVRALLEECFQAGRPVVVVSNTVSGRSVRSACAAHGIDHLIAASVCSDEAGWRKPDSAMVREALQLADADPSRSIFYGDKPQNDAVAARACGIGRRVLVRGGSTEDAALDAALAEGLATDVVAEADELIALLGTPARAA